MDRKTRISVATLKAGNIAMVGYKGWHTKNVFLGLTDNSEKHSTKPRFKCLRELKQHCKVRSAKELEKLEQKKGYGYSFYAVFMDMECGQIWTAYLFEGRWSVGTSADALQIREILNVAAV